MQDSRDHALHVLQKIAASRRRSTGAERAWAALAHYRLTTTDDPDQTVVELMESLTHLGQPAHDPRSKNLLSLLW